MNLLLCNTMFDRENDNVLLFNNKEELAQYFNNLTNKVIINNINFNANDIINTSVVVKVDNNLNLYQILNYNYCVVIQGNNLPNLYYFIEKSSQDNGPYVRLSLVIDPINTYIYDIVGENLKTQGLIQRTHTDRFYKKDNSYFSYNFNNTSSLFERETLKDISKRITSKQQLKIRIDTANNILNNFIADNVAMWQYIYLSSNTEYNYFNFDGSTPTTKRLRALYYGTEIGETIDSNFVVIAVPIMKTGKEIKIKRNNITRTWGNVDYFLSVNNNYAKVQAIKYSIIPPLEIKDYTGEYEIDTDGNLILTGDSIGDAGITSKFIAVSEQTTSNTIAQVITQYLTQGFDLYTDAQFMQFSFLKNEITNDNEPKLLNEDYSTYRLFIGGQQYDLPISKTSNKPEFILRETLAPDITKANICFKTSSSPMQKKIFTDITQEDFSGFNLSIDLSMWYPSGNLDFYLASNKNYLQIFNNRQTLAQQQQALKVGGNIVTGQLGAQDLLSSTNLAITQMYEKDNLNLTLDNMRNTPETTGNINSNSMLIYAVSGFGLFIEKLELLPFEKSIIIDNLKLFGYNYNKIGYLNDYIKTRKYYNYIQAIIYDIDAQIAEQVKDRIKQVFRNGVRFWHADAWEDLSQVQINFDLNNIERSVING